MVFNIFKTIINFSCLLATTDKSHKIVYFEYTFKATNSFLFT